mmetsp:Transcript_27195/g.37835  ORF Transcript_27195/g.37835 Transcript_27195/m.37835 type:complete len:307 (+) Transcript_27195:138-1058(+)
MANPIFEVLHGMKVEEVGSSKDIVVVKTDDPLEETVKCLEKNKITSAPVVDKSGAVQGYVDMLDIVNFIVEVSPDEWCLTHDVLRSLETAGRAISLVPTGEIINASGRDAYIPVYENDPATEALSHFSYGIHRIAIVDKEGAIKHSMSQSDMARVLSEELKRSHCKHVASKSVSSLGLGVSKPVVVEETTSVLEALKIMNKHSFSALAIVGENGKLRGNFSATDLVGLYQQEKPEMLLSLVDYLMKYSEKSLNAISIRPETSLMEAVQVMFESRVHRVWVIDDDFKPCGIVSCTDVAAWIRQYVYE